MAPVIMSRTKNLGRRGWVALAIGIFLTSSVTAEARVLCTLVVEAESGNVIVEQGDCERRVTPASTFKVPLALMGYDSGLLVDENTPVLPFREGYPAWGGAAWKQPVGPRQWLKHSVVWYSQQIARMLGTEQLERYARDLRYGNADFSGDPGKDNGLERAWIGSSLKVSPVEQVAFLRKLLSRDLAVSRVAMDRTIEIVDTTSSAGWRISGKTGSAFPRHADGSLDRAHGWGWYVGWAGKDGRTYVFARLTQDERREQGPAGLRTRDRLLEELPALLESAGGL